MSPPAKVALALEVVVTYLRTRQLLRRHDLPRAVEELRRAGPLRESDPAMSSVVTGPRLARAVTRTLPLLPSDTRCLMRSLVLLGLLSHRQIDCVLVIGVRAGPDFAAHAWVEVDGAPLLASQEKIFSRVAEL